MMNPRVVRALSYSNVMATLALFVAIGGTSYAAVTLSGANIKDGTVRSVDIADGLYGIQSRDVRNGSLGAIDLSTAARASLKGNTGATGATGAAGSQGVQGTAGALGAQGPTGLINIGAWHQVGAVGEPAFGSDFMSHPTVPMRFRLEGDGVRISGAFNQANIAADPTWEQTDTVIFTLPVGFRPALGHAFSVPGSQSSEPGAISLGPSGGIGALGSTVNTGQIDVWFPLTTG